MKKINYLLSITAICATAVFTGCSKDDNKLTSVPITLDFSSTKLNYSETTDAWSDVFDSSYDNALIFGAYQFSHQGFSTESYSYFYGFCPSKSKDINEYQNWVPDHQFSAIAGKSVLESNEYPNHPYMVAFWDEYGDTEDGDLVPNNPSCAITNAKPFKPLGLYVTNSTYTYYAMKNGTAFNDKFTKDDYLTLSIHGAIGGRYIGKVDVDLARNGVLLTKWEPVKLESLGEVDMIFFTMSSSSKNEYGMCVPGYFCLDGFTVDYSLQ